VVGFVLFCFKLSLEYIFPAHYLRASGVNHIQICSCIPQVSCDIKSLAD